MPVLYEEDFESVTPPALPVGLTFFGDTWLTTDEWAYSGANSLTYPVSNNPGYFKVDEINTVGNSLRATAWFRFGGSPNVILFAMLLRNLANTYVGVYCRLTPSIPAQCGMFLYDTESPAELVHLGDETTWDIGEWYQVIFELDGASLRIEIVRDSDNWHLNDAGVWQIGFANAYDAEWLEHDDMDRVEIHAVGNDINVDRVYIDDLLVESLAVALNGGTISQGTIGATTATLNEVTPATNGASPYTYQWEIDDGGGYDPISGATNGATVNIIGLTPLTEYDVRRKATDNASATAYSDVETFTTGAALSGGTIAAGATTSTTQVLTSSVASSGGDGTRLYQWQRKTALEAFADVSGATLATLTDTGLTPSTTYDYRRKTTDTATTIAYSNTITITTDAPASLDGGTIAEGTVTNTTASLTSTVPASGGTGSITYQWKRKLGAGSYANVSGATSATLSDSGLTPLTGYTYKRTATDSIAATADSNEIAITTSATTGAKMKAIATTGLNLYVHAENDGGQVWNTGTLEFEDYSGTNWEDYSIPLVERGTTGRYYEDIPDVLTADVFVYRRIGSTPASTDTLMGASSVVAIGNATAIQIRQEMDSNSTQLAKVDSILNQMKDATLTIAGNGLTGTLVTPDYTLYLSRSATTKPFSVSSTAP